MGNSKSRRQRKRAVARELQAQPSEAVRKRVQARYDAAQTTKENSKHWSYADALSADAANSPSVRATLRNRARYEVANNSYARGIVNFIASDTVGTNIRLSLTADQKSYNTNLLLPTREEARFVEGEFACWMDETGMTEKVRLLRSARAVDGEGMGLFANNPLISHPVKLDLGLVECERCTDPWGRAVDGRNVDGIEYDIYNNPTLYRFLKTHPGGEAWMSPSMLYETMDVRASNVIHLFAKDRVEQRRGIPELTPCLNLFAMLRRFTLAVLAAAETAADFAGIMKTMSPPDADDVVSSDPFDRVELERNALLTLPEGWDMQQFKPEQPVSTYAEFKREILGEIARPMNVPINVALGDSSDHNYASGRLDWQTWFKARNVDRGVLKHHVLDRLFKAWINEAILIEGYLPQRLRNVNTRWDLHNWLFDGDEHVDPLKEANAQAVRLANNATTLEDEWGKKGRDWEERLEQIARERDKMLSLGITLDDLKHAPEPDDDEDEKKAKAGYEFNRDPVTGQLMSLRRL